MMKNSTKALRLLESVKSDLVLGSKTNPAEQAIEDLGTLLGLKASRPDNTKKIGPDILWLSPDDNACWGFEAKTDKDEESSFNKSDTGQAHEHRQWLADNFPEHDSQLALVGRLLPVTPNASPDASLKILTIESLRQLLLRVEDLYNRLVAEEYKEDIVQGWLEHLGLVFPQCVDGLPMTLAVDMQAEPT